jgi:voltage-gated potassium channel
MLSGHIIVCGLGRVGYRIVGELQKLGEDIVVIEKDHDNTFANELRNKGVPVIFTEARSLDSLETANVRKAKAVIACTNDDMANLEIALNCRQVVPEMKVVVRLFDDVLAKKVEQTFGIPAVSTSHYSAPAFVASATDRSVYHSFYLGRYHLHVADVTIAAKSPFVGKSIGEVENLLDLTFVLYKNATITDLRPQPSTVLQCGDKVVVLSTLEKILLVERVNSGKENIPACIDQK